MGAQSTVPRQVVVAERIKSRHSHGVPDRLEELRDACVQVAARASHVRIDEAVIPDYGQRLISEARPRPDPDVHLLDGPREDLAAFWLTLDAINFGSGWFPTLRKRPGCSGYHTIASGLRERFATRGPWTAADLQAIGVVEIASALGQDPAHELMALFVRSLRDLGQRVEHAGSFLAAADSAKGSALALVQQLAGWECFADCSRYGSLKVPFLKRAQIAAADLHRAGVARFADLERLTMFADNLVPHVLRMDGVLIYERALLERIDRSELIPHDSPEEVEIRACALHAVELIVAAAPAAHAAAIDQVLWLRGQGARYKASPRHRTRCTAY